jgi:hypothetical protein
MGDALATLFGSARSLSAAAGVFSELAWQIQDREFLKGIALVLKRVQVAPSSNLGRHFDLSFES